MDKSGCIIWPPCLEPSLAPPCLEGPSLAPPCLEAPSRSLAPYPWGQGTGQGTEPQTSPHIRRRAPWRKAYESQHLTEQLPETRRTAEPFQINLSHQKDLREELVKLLHSTPRENSFFVSAKDRRRLSSMHVLLLYGCLSSSPS